MYANYKKNQGELLDLKMPLEPIREAPKLQVLNAKAPPPLSSLVNAPRLLSEGRNMSMPAQEKRSSTLTNVKKLASIDSKSKHDGYGSPVKFSSQNAYTISDSGASNFPSASILSSTRSLRSEMDQHLSQRNCTADSGLPIPPSRKDIETVHSVPKIQSENHQQSSTLKHQLSPLVPKKLIHREKLEPIGKIKAELSKVSHIKDLNQQKLKVDEKFDHVSAQIGLNTEVLIKKKKLPEERNTAEKKLYELQNEHQMQSENMKKHQENRLKEKKRELSQHYDESQEENEHFADVGFSSKNQEIYDSSTTLYQGTAGLSSENKEDIKKTCVNEIEDVHESTNKSIASRSELNLLNELVLNKQETLDVLEAEILALKNEKSEFILEKEHLTNDMQEEYENSKKIQIEKDLLLKDIDELQLEADNIENDLDLLRTEKSKLCLELKGIKSDINERSVEFKKIQESLNMEVHGKKKGNVELDENLVLDVILSDFGCQVNMEDSTISHDSNNNNSVQVLANKKVGTDVLFSSTYVQVEKDFYSEKNFSDQQISTELQQSDFSCQTGNSVPNTDQPVQVKPLCSAKSVNTVSSIPSLLSTKDLSVQVNMKENIVLDAACQTMAMTELHNCSALDTKANSTNVLNVIASAKSELESKMNPLYHRLQLLEEAVCLKSNKNEENSGGGVDNNTKQQLDSEQLNSTFELLQDFNTSDQKLKSNAKQQHELLISIQGFKALCSYENPNSTDSKPYSTHKSIRDPRNAAILEYANASGSYTLAEASAILRYIQNQKSEELPCSSINEKILQQPIFQPSQEAPYGNIFQLEDTTISDSTKPQICNAPVLENASESAAAKEDANLSEMYRLAEAFLHIYRKVNTQKEEKSNGWLSENEDQSRTGISPSQNTVQRSPYGNSFQFEVSVSTDSEKQQTSAVGNNPKSSAIDDINLSETCRLAEAFLQTREQKNSQKKRLSNNWTKGGLFQESAAVPASQIAPQTSAYGHYYNYRETPSAGIFNDSTNSQVRNSDVSSRNDPKPAVDDTSLSEMNKSAEAFLRKRHMKHLRNDKLSNGWMNEHLSQTYIGMTREQNIPQVRNVQDYALSKESPTTEFREIHSSQVFTTSSPGTSFTSFIEEWINNRNKELNVLTEIRKRLRLYGKCNF